MDKVAKVGLRRGSSLLLENPQRTVESTIPFIRQVIDDPKNKPTVARFMKHPVHLKWAKGLEKDPESAKDFFEFAMVDYYYWGNRGKIKAASLGSVDVTDLDLLVSKQEDFDRNLDQMKTWYNTVVIRAAQLAYPKITLEDTNAKIKAFAQRTDAMDAVDKYIKSYVTWHQNPEYWYDAELISAGCYYGWGMRAVEYENDPKTIKAGLYYEVMVLPFLKKAADGKVLKVNGLAQLDDAAEKYAGKIQKSAKAYTFNGKEEDPGRVNMVVQSSFELEISLLDLFNKTGSKM